MSEIRKRVRLWLGLSYRCRCWAIVDNRNRSTHEIYHAALREWMSPPTAEEMAWATGRVPPSPAGAAKSTK